MNIIPGEIYFVRGFRHQLWLAISGTTFITKLINAPDLTYANRNSYDFIGIRATPIDLMRSWGVTSAQFEQLVGTTLRAIYRERAAEFPALLLKYFIGDDALQRILQPAAPSPIKKPKRAVKPKAPRQKKVREPKPPKPPREKKLHTDESKFKTEEAPFTPLTEDQIFEAYGSKLKEAESKARAGRDRAIAAALKHSSIRQVAKEFRLSSAQVARIAKKYKVKLRKPGGKKGAKIVRKPKSDYAKIQSYLPQLQAQEISVQEVAEKLGVHRNTVRRALAKAEVESLPRAKTTYPSRRPRKAVMGKLQQVLNQLMDDPSLTLYKACLQAGLSNSEYRTIQNLLKRHKLTVADLVEKGLPPDWRTNPATSRPRYLEFVAHLKSLIEKYDRISLDKILQEASKFQIYFDTQAEAAELYQQLRKEQLPHTPVERPKHNQVCEYCGDTFRVSAVSQDSRWTYACGRCFSAMKLGSNRTPPSGSARLPQLKSRSRRKYDPDYFDINYEA